LSNFIKSDVQIELMQIDQEMNDDELMKQSWKSIDSSIKDMEVKL